MRSDIEVVVAQESGQFARMIAGLLAANLKADPDKGVLAGRTRGMIGFVVTDTDEEVLLRFSPLSIHVSDGIADGAGMAHLADLRLVGSSDTIMALSTVPLRFGLPDPLSAAGRGLTGRWIGGGLEVHGLPRQAPLLRTLLQLCNVLS